MTDVVLTAFLTRGRDDFRTGRKVSGEERKAGELTHEQQAEYIRPARFSAAQHGHDTVVIHDGLHWDVMHQCPEVRFCCAVGLPDWNAFERRWVAMLNYLHARDDVERVWFVDANDVLFVRHPFDWMTEHVHLGQIAVGQEHVRMKGNEWFEAGVKPLPHEYREFLIDKHGGEYGISCGCWATDRHTAIRVIDLALQRITSLQHFLSHSPPGYPVCLDMFAFAVVWFLHFPARLVRFAMDGRLGSPLIHDRTKVMSLIPPN